MSTSKSYRTRQREQIAAAAADFGSKHFTAFDVHEVLAEKEEAVGISTVYRHLDRMVEENQLRRFYLGVGDAACYQNVVSSGEACHRHYHLKCERCGRLFHTVCPEIDHFTSHMEKHHGFAIDHAKTVFYGICEACRES